MEKKRAAIWEEDYVIPTYKVYPPEKNPLFIEKRVYQGSSGKVYPFPVTEKISDEKEDVAYRAVFLENEYLKVMVLPELGGRIQRAVDKTNNYDFVYYNHVIKPALVGLAGPWISGGIEFNWPQHHRPSTYLPVDYKIAENPDGSCTVHLSETDRMYGTKGMASITLYPGKAYIEIRGQLYNHTDLPQTFLWWANPAVPVNDHTYSVFPPDVNAVMDHGKRAVSTFPIATGEYYKCDYSAGVDISRYKNVKVPTSYMAAHSDYNFIGNYDESVEAGLLHVADHHISPGKKQWTWGNGDFGRFWDRNLTDEDGPYIELMTGVFTDNQPDFTWLKPGEEKTFVQYFMPYKGVGRVGNATKEAAVSIAWAGNDENTDEREIGSAGTSAAEENRNDEMSAAKEIVNAGTSAAEEIANGGVSATKESGNNELPVVLKVYATARYENAVITVKENGSIRFEETAVLTPEECFEAYITGVHNLEDCTVTVCADGKVLVDYEVYKEELRPIPEPAEVLGAPQDLKSLEELYLAATHLEQYRHATYDPADYYLEGLKRDATDIRLNNGYGLLLYRRGMIRESIPYFKAAIEKQTWKNPNPYFGECYFNLGLALEADGQEAEAYDAFYKATWSAETQSGGFYWLANLEARRGNYEEALAFADKSLIRNWHNMKTRTLKLALMRKLGLDSAALLAESLAIDPLYMGCLYEKAVWEGSPNEKTASESSPNGKAVPESSPAEKSASQDSLAEWKHYMRKDAHNYLELALDYAKAGLYEDASQILEACPDAEEPLHWYYLGWISSLKHEDAAGWVAKGESCQGGGFFPNRVEEIRILETAIAVSDAAPMAHYHLGNLLYDKKRYGEAVAHWEAAAAKKPDLAAAWRNLAIAYYNKKNQPEKAMEAMERACETDASYPRLWLEYDQLAARAGKPNEERLAVLEAHPDCLAQRDDLNLRRITLLNCTGRYEEALEALKAGRFHPWEGGEGKTAAQYRYALIHLAQERLEKCDPQAALRLLRATLSYPENLGEGKLPNVPDNEAYYYMGKAYRMLGDEAQTERCFRLASGGPQEPSSAVYYNEQPSDFIYYQGLAFRELGEEERARKSFHQLIIFGEKHVFDHVKYDYFAVSMPELEVFQDDIALRNRQYCNYLRALGCLGLGRRSEAAQLLDDVLAKQKDYQGAIAHRVFC